MHDSVATTAAAPGAEAGAGYEANLVARARMGDRDALDELCREHWLAVYRVVCGSVRTQDEAEDLTQEVFVRAITALSSVRDPDLPYRAYLLRIARNLAIDRWRARQRRGYLPEAELSEHVDPAPGPEDVAITRDERDRLLAALDRLPDDYNDVLRLRILWGRTAAEAGEVRGQSANAIRQLQFRALAALRRELAAQTQREQRGEGEPR